MEQMDTFAVRLDRRLEEAQAALAARARDDEQLMQERLDAHERLAAAAEAVHGRCVRPALEALARRFPNAIAAHYRTPCGFVSECRFAHTARYPAAAKVGLALEWDPAAEHAWLQYTAELVPLLVPLESGDRSEVTLDAPAQEAIRGWAEAKLLAFVDTYLLVASSPQYQIGNLRTDPVCGMQVPKWSAEHTHEWSGRTYQFCSSLCRDVFAASPALFLTGRAQLPPDRQG